MSEEVSRLIERRLGGRMGAGKERVVHIGHPWIESTVYIIHLSRKLEYKVV